MNLSNMYLENELFILNGKFVYFDEIYENPYNKEITYAFIDTIGLLYIFKECGRRRVEISNEHLIHLEC